MSRFLTVILFLLFSSQLIFSQINSNMSVSLIRNSGDSGDYLSPGDILNMGAYDFTIEVKILVNSFPLKSENGAKIINKGLSSSGTPQNAGYGFRVWEDNGINELIFMLSDGAVSGITSIEVDSLETGSCYHVAAVRQGNVLMLYLDGNLVADSTTPVVIDADNNLVFTIGALSRAPFAQTTEFFDGLIDEVRVWNIVRSQTQLSLMMNDTLSAAYYSTPDSGLMAYYRCDYFEDLGIGSDGPDDIRDFSVNAFHADTFDEPVIAANCSVVGVSSEFSIAPNNFELLQNFPNPFNPITTISFSIQNESYVQLLIYNSIGQEIMKLVNEEKPIGKHELNWNASKFPSGIYFYQLRAGNYTQTKKMLLIK